MWSHKIDIYVLYASKFVSFFFKYWLHDGPLRPKLVANSNITINIIELCQIEYLYSSFLLMLNGRATGKGRKCATGIIFQHLTGGVGKPRNMYQVLLKHCSRIPLMWLAQVAYIKQSKLPVKNTLEDTTSTSVRFPNKHYFLVSPTGNAVFVVSGIGECCYRTRDLTNKVTGLV